MTHERDIETLLDQWFVEGPNEVPDRVLDIVRDRIERQPQRTVWRVAWRGPEANRFALIGVAAAVVALAAIAVSLAGKPPTIPPTIPPSPIVSPGPTATTATPPALTGAGLVVYEHWTPGLTFRLEYLGSDARGHELLPLEITRTIPPDRPLGKKLETRSQHRVNWALSGEDQKKIDHAGDMMATFQLISYDEYCGVGKPAPAKQAKR